MYGTRMATWVLGLVLVILAIALLFFTTGLDRFVPVSVAAAALLLIVGVAVMAMADRVGAYPTDRTYVDERYVERPTYIERPPRRFEERRVREEP
ncbi:MAG TPA: hypothetical protein VM681_10860 [Candidatus Thermoplasmatota archaeon]|nr:hypothetical protein [Candidatus Thermoplasmatota archaeon]